MILIINTADFEEVFLGLADKESFIAKIFFKAKYKQAEKLLVEIDKLLKANKLTKLKAIIVVNGPGPFTALRIGVVTANTMSWALKIPIVSIKLSEFKDIDDLLRIGYKKLAKTKPGKIIEPFYGKEPNITKNKKLKK